MKSIVRWALGAGTALTLMASAANAVTFDFTQITNNPTPNVGSQLQVDVTASGLNQVLFTFSNLGPILSVIEAIYFDDSPSDVLDPPLTILNGPGVVFGSIGNNGNADLPGGNAVTFVTSDGFKTDADNPAPHKGINVGESLGIMFNLSPLNDFQDVIDALSLGGENGLRIGLHVTGIAGLTSNSYINGTGGGGGGPSPVPVPAALPLLLAALGGLGLVARRRRRVIGPAI